MYLSQKIVDAMENKKLFEQELKLINQLLDVVNSKEEFDYLLAEKARLLSYSTQLKGGAQKW